MDAVPREARIHGLDALMILCRRVQGGSADTRAIQRIVYARVKEVDRAQAEAWILRELRHGDYYVNRAVLGETAHRLGPDVWIKARKILEDAIVESRGSIGTASYWALRYLGERERAENARKRHQARKAEERND